MSSYSTGFRILQVTKNTIEPTIICIGKIIQLLMGRNLKNHTESAITDAMPYDKETSFNCIHEEYPRSFPEYELFRKKEMTLKTIFTYSIGKIPTNAPTNNGAMAIIFFIISSTRVTSLLPCTANILRFIACNG